MSLAVGASAAPAVDVSSRSVSAREVQQSEVRCLVVAPSVSRLEMLSRAAMKAGWDVIPCASPEEGMRAHQRERYELGIVDLGGLDAEAATEFRRVSEEVSPNSLLMLCGNEGDALEEIWARQQGAWLYLPGVSEEGDVSMLCGEARKVVDRQLEVDEPRRSVA